jgi:cation/acetate symporter
MTLLAMWGWIYQVPIFMGKGLLPATSSALIVCPLAFAINILVSNLTHHKITAESAERMDDILRKLHNMADSVEEAAGNKKFSPL